MATLKEMQVIIVFSLTFLIRTAEEKKKWMEAIQEALNSVTPVQRINSTHDPAMHSFTRPVHCQVCAKLLKGLFYQVRTITLF